MSRAGRLLAAAALCVVALGLGWSTSMASTGYQTPGTNISTLQIEPFSDDLSLGLTYMPGWWVEGDPFRTRKGHAADVRVVLVPAAVVLAVAARHGVGSPAVARGLRIAVGALAVLALVALSRGMYAAMASMVAALALAGPVVFPRAGARWVPRRFQPAERG